MQKVHRNEKILKLQNPHLVLQCCSAAVLKIKIINLCQNNHIGTHRKPFKTVLIDFQKLPFLSFLNMADSSAAVLQ